MRGSLAARPLQRIDDPFDVIIDVALKIRVPDDLLAVDGFAVDDRRAFAVRTAEVETDPAAVEMAAEPEPDLLRFRRGFIRAADDGERMIVDFFADHGITELPFAAGGVDLRQLGNQFRSSRRPSASIRRAPRAGT